MKFNLKSHSDELHELDESLNKNKKEKMIDKLLQSKEIDKLIVKVQLLYHKISEKLFVKYDLKNELKQGKLFTILIATLIFLYLVITTILFVIMLNSLIGLNFIFSLLKYSIFFIKWGYTILKNKGSVIQRYLAVLFPNSKILTKKVELKKEKEQLPAFEGIILKEIEKLISKIKTMNIDLESEKEIVLQLKEIVTSLNLLDETFENELKTLDYKKDICEKLVKVECELESIIKDEILNNNLKKAKDEVIYNIESLEKKDEEKSTSYQKKLRR